MNYLLFMKEKDTSDYSSANEIEVSSLMCSEGGKRLNKILFSLIPVPLKSKLVHVDDERGQMHASYLLGKSFKFPFLGQDDYEIGPCVTRVDCRGRGLYPDVLRFFFLFGLW